jgi:uncharacterized coiled-coil protein SlyX
MFELKGEGKMHRAFMSFILFLFLSIALSACSGKQEESNKAVEDMAISKNMNKAEMDVTASEEKKVQTINGTNPEYGQNRMIVYHADMRIKVNDFYQAQSSIEKLVKDLGGYVVESHLYDSENEKLEGSLTARVPHEQLQFFLQEVEKRSVKVYHRNSSGQDVTEEYVDLEARLKAKEVVEKRLLDFMKTAKQTKDLLEISKDLASVQEEIEQIKGRIKYLQNQSALSTVSISLESEKVVVPNLNKDDLKTWEKTKKQFKESIQLFNALCSAIFVFLIGNSPFILLLGMIVIVIYFIVRMKRKNLRDNQKPKV